MVRYTTLIANYVSSCSSTVPSLALCAVPSDQCDDNQCCPGFDKSVVCVVNCCECVGVCTVCVFVCGAMCGVVLCGMVGVCWSKW